jgi:hypothetical protein
MPKHQQPDPKCQEPNDENWNRRTSEWVEMTHRSRAAKEAHGKSRQRTETNLTDQERDWNPEPYKGKPHGTAIPPQDPK